MLKQNIIRPLNISKSREVWIHEDLEIEDYKSGLVLIDKKFVVSLIDNNWRVLNKNTWYKHKDIKHFVSNYIRKDTA